MRTLARRRATTRLSSSLALLCLGLPRQRRRAHHPARADNLIRYLIADRVYYYAVSGCCDQLNPLFDAEGKDVCAPDGGFTGRGDRRCPAELVGIERWPGTSVPNRFYRRR